MPKLTFVKGTTSLIIIVFIQDDTATNGSGLAGLIHTSGITGGYVKRNDVGVAVAVDEDVAAEGTYQAPSNAAHIRIGTPANMIAGVYELHLHDTHLTTEDYVTISLSGAADMAPLLIEIQLSSINQNDAVRAGMTALPNAAAQAAGGLYTQGAGAGQINQDANGRIDVNIEAISADAGAPANLESDYDGTGYNKAASTIALCTANSDMVGTNNAALAATALSTVQWTNARAAFLDELAAANLPTDVANLNAQNVLILVDTAAIIAQNVLVLVDTGAIGAQNVAILVDTGTLLARLIGTILAGNHTAQTGDSFARIGAPSGASVSADILAIQGSLPPRIEKNAALANFKFILVSNVDHVTGVILAAPAATRSIDGAGFAPCANAVAEIAFGAYRIDLAAADLNGDTIMLRFTAAGADDRFIEIVTQV